MNSQSHRFALAGGMLCAVFAAANANAAIITIDPFTGDYTDTFDQYSSTMAVQTLDVFDGTATLSNLSTGGAIKIEWSSTLNGDHVGPISGMMAGQLGIGRWVFDQPALRFGGWFENNSMADDASLNFYDETNRYIGHAVADIPVDGEQWIWNGWESTIPIKTIEVIGNGLINGFIWYENMQVTYVPEPASLSLLILGGFTALSLHRRR